MIYLMRGIQGSGKTTWAIQNLGGKIPWFCSADHYFFQGGVYRFDPAHLPAAHGACLRRYLEGLQVGHPCIVVDNTNISAVELAPYVALAQAFGVDYQITRLECNPWDAAERNQHGVPTDRVLAAWERLRDERLPPFWKPEVVIKAG